MQIFTSAYGAARAAVWSAVLGAAIVAASAAPAAAFDAKQIERSVVRVLISPPDRIASMGHGTGFVVADEYIVTNWHVATPDSLVKANKAYKLYVINPFIKDWLPAEIIWSSQELDLAVIRVKGLGMPSLELTGLGAFEHPGKGQPVIVVGYPGKSDQILGSEQNISDLIRQATVNRGVVGRTLNATMSGKLRPIIQHDAAINQGNSGGPLFDDCNRVVGVNTWNWQPTFQIVKDEKGNQVATGNLAYGSFFSSHASNLIDAIKTVPQLKAIRLHVSSDTCEASEGGTSPIVIVLSGVTLLIALGAAGLVVFRRREVVRVVESYSAWIQRKGVAPGAKRTDSAAAPRAPARPPSGPRRATNVDATQAPAHAPAAAPKGDGSWTLSGTDSNKQAVSLTLAPAELKKAADGAEKGLVLGRSASMADKVLNDPSISRRHAKLSISGGTLTIEDLKSAYGTKVNGQALEPFQPTEINDGDSVVIGAVTLEVRR